MKLNHIKKIFSTSVFLLFVTIMPAQTMHTGYFLEGFFDRHHLNPALTPERNYFSLPFIGQFSVDLFSTVGLSNFIYESTSSPGKLTTFMSPDIAKSTFLKSLPEVSRIGVKMDLDLLSMGFRGFKGYNTISLNLRNSEYISLPKELFDFMKSSLSDGNYLIKDINVNSTTYMELAFGHSHKIDDKLTIGAKFKYLIGIAYADLNIDQIHAVVGGDSWSVNANATMKAAVSGLYFTNKDPATKEFEGAEFDFKGLSGSGVAFDLGAEYNMEELVQGLTLSASLTDLGAIKWQRTNIAATRNDQPVVFEGFGVDGADMEETMDKLQEDFEGLLKLYDNGQSIVKTGIGATMRLGAKYVMPFYSGLSAGMLLTQKTGLCKYSEARLSLILSPNGWFDLTGNAALSSYGATYGWLVNVHPAGFNLFFGTDSFKIKFNPQFIPISGFRTNLVFGIKFPIGKKII